MDKPFREIPIPSIRTHIQSLINADEIIRIEATLQPILAAQDRTGLPWQWSKKPTS